MNADLIQRLRRRDTPDGFEALCNEAADTIERLAASPPAPDAGVIERAAKAILTERFGPDFWDEAKRDDLDGIIHRNARAEAKAALSAIQIDDPTAARRLAKVLCSREARAKFKGDLDNVLRWEMECWERFLPEAEKLIEDADLLRFTPAGSGGDETGLLSEAESVVRELQRWALTFSRTEYTGTHIEDRTSKLLARLKGAEGSGDAVSVKRFWEALVEQCKLSDDAGKDGPRWQSRGNRLFGVRVEDVEIAFARADSGDAGKLPPLTDERLISALKDLGWWSDNDETNAAQRQALIDIVESVYPEVST